MASILVVEDGTGLSTANTYCDLAFANEYHTLYGNSDWAGDDTALEQALVQAAQSLDLLYGSRYNSYKVDTGNPSTRQALEWPRYGFGDTNMTLRAQGEIPLELKRAQAEVALMAVMGTDILPTQDNSNAVQSESVRVGDIQTSVTYRSPTTAPTYEGFNKIDALLRPILKKKQTALKMSR